MTEKTNSKSDSREEQPQNEQLFNQEQYDRLLACSKKGPEGIKEWNKWRKEYQVQYMRLQGAELQYSVLQGVELYNANLQGAKLWGSNLQGAQLWSADLQAADLRGINLQGANLVEADLKGSNFRHANLQDTNLWGGKLQGAKFRGVIVNGSTNFFACEIDKKTDLRETGMEDTRIESGTKILLKYNIRRMNWKDWYKEHWFLRWPVKLFWLISDYGRSTGRIMLTFFALAIAFTFVYFLQPNYVMVNDVVGDIRGFVHALYFSVVTMTTLGFGDIAANPDSWPGQVVLMLQVILGYVLLGALVTRLAILFTSDGPAGSFTPMDKKTKELLAKLKEDEDKEKAK